MVVNFKKLLISFLDIFFPNRKLNLFYEYSITNEEIQANKEIISNEINLQKLNSICWFLPEIKNINAGGIATIFKISEYLTKNSKCKHYFVFHRGNIENYKKIISSIYPELLFEIIIFSAKSSKTMSNLPTTDVGICTFWTTAFSLAKYNQCKKKYYLLQDDERCFYDYGSTRELVESTYKFGFKGIANSNYICNMYKEKSNSECYRYLPGVNENYFLLNRFISDEEPVNIVVYCRPSHARNCFESIILAVKKVAESEGERVIFHLVGERISRREYNLPDNCIVLGHVDDEDKLKELYEKCLYGISFISTPTISYHQLDLINSKVCLVSNKNMEIENIFSHGEILYCDVTPESISTYIRELIYDKEIARSTIEISSKKIREFNWNHCLVDIEKFIRMG